MNTIDVVEAAKEIETLLSKEFLAWLPQNLHVWEAFRIESFKARDKGFKHYSSKTIIHFLRHHSAINEVGGAWKINNNYSPYLARLFDHCFPGFVGLWEYRETKRAKADHAKTFQD